MAGVVPFSSSTPGRKQWNIRDRKSSRRLRSELAENGCPESQLVLAKQLLKEKSVVNENDSEENARLGVFWLIKASEQGNVEATNILRECLESGEGITEHNYLDVKACLSTTQNEKLAKRAAHELFMSLSAGQDFITSEQLRRRMRMVDLGEPPLKLKASAKVNSNNESNSLEADNAVSNSTADDNSLNYDDPEYPAHLLDWTGKETFGEKLTEEHLENAAVTYSRGELPLVQRILTLTDPGNREIDNPNYLHRALFHPFRTVHASCLKVLDHFNSRCRINLLPSSSFLQIILIMIGYQLITLDSMLIFVPLFLYYLSFFFMIFSTLQMLQAKNEYSNFRVWSRLFLSYDRDGNLNTEDAEFEYCKKHLRPFAVYFFSLLINLVVYPFISGVWIPQSEFAIVAIALTFTTLYYFHEKLSSKKIDFLMLVSFAVYVLAKYPYETDGVVYQGWRFLDLKLPALLSYGLPCFASQIVGTGVEFCINFRLFFYLLIPPIFLKMASRDNWKGIYKILIPHCVTLSWWQIAILCCQGATLYGLIRSTLALVGLIFFLPIIAVATIALPILAILKHFTDLTLTPKTSFTTILASIPLVVAYFIDKRRGAQLGSYLTKIQVFLAIISAIFLLCPSVTEYLTDAEVETGVKLQPTITWDEYSSLCRKTSWNKRTEAEIQKECVHFHGASVNWEGFVEDVRIVKITNNFLKVVDNLPEALGSKLICLYGEEYEEDCGRFSDEMKAKFCKTVKQVNIKHKCHARSWDRYEFEIKLKMKSNAWNDAESTVFLEVEDCFKNFTLNLRIKDNIWFSGYLNRPETIGSDDLLISIEEMGCINCETKDLTSHKSQRSKYRSANLLRECLNGFKRVLNFIFYPVVIFR